MPPRLFLALTLLWASLVPMVAAGQQQDRPKDPPRDAAREPGAKPDDAPADVSREQQMLDELKEQAREDLRVWEARVKARQSWVREATLRVDAARAWRDAIDKRVKQGAESAGMLKQNELEVAELEARRDQKAVELAEAETRVSRLKRRLAVLQRADKYEVMGPSLGPESPFRANAAEERILDLEQQLERLRAEMDETRQTARLLRMKDEQPNAPREKRGNASAR